MSDFPNKLQRKLDKRYNENSIRQLGESSSLVDFSSNDYLGFANNEELFSKTFQLLLNKNIAQNGATGSRLLSGNYPLFSELEKMLAEFHNVENALVFNSGYDANIGFFGAVPQRGDFVFYDEWIHASIRDGLLMTHAKSYKFSHNDLTDLKKKITTILQSKTDHVDSEIYVVTESVFSMDGDSPDLKELVRFCKTNAYRLVIDEAHAVGVFGDTGQGLVQELGLQNHVFARLVTFGKAMGVHGAAILGENRLKEYLVNFARSFIYSTALAPYSTVSIVSAYDFLVNEGNSERQQLKENIRFFKEEVKKKKLNSHFIESDSAIQSCILPSNDMVKSVSDKLAIKGFDVKAILSPTVPQGTERLRFCIHSYNSKEELGLVLQLLSTYI
ncbi:aminotransferase class I/II-fold pyridoxal phosphate-dependent enzyme [Maribacter sp. MMG018]|uniref:aminotransferase class I/II-fold pyridoxal phosphate-dependent enzyme n=1 Tax=Maribacter sp. MMG018 TaxID=2822688 RepID=UPI001B365000|nr:aminotransferase class I/II-fold pyridoxal phosphate-dependent enzyme [Maribacter sp. MMG018]MBQ4913112.1 aminotransferase class I/II-fold pyridoxal phosphate-dependent enzyme [Maribacter sp. MMG018]